MWQLLLGMIQRIQSIYLLGATILSGGLILLLNLWIDGVQNDFFVLDAFKSGERILQVMAVLFIVSALLSFSSIFQYKKRQLQFVLGRLTILINFIIIGILVYYSQNLSGEITVSEKGIGLLIPIVTIVLVALANKSIKKDEELVKSVDRLR